MPKARRGGHVERNVWSMTGELLGDNQEALLRVGKHLEAQEYDKLMTLVVEIAGRNAAMQIATILLEENLINRAEEYLLDFTNERK